MKVPHLFLVSYIFHHILSIRPQTSKVEYDAPVSDRLLALLGMTYSDRQRIRPQTSPIRMSKKSLGGPRLNSSFSRDSIDFGDLPRPSTSEPQIVQGMFPAVEGARPSTSPTRKIKAKGMLTANSGTYGNSYADARPWTANSMRDDDSNSTIQSAGVVQLSPLQRNLDRPSSSTVIRSPHNPKLNTHKKMRPKTGLVRRQRRKHTESVTTRKSTSFLASVDNFGVGGKKKRLVKK